MNPPEEHENGKREIQLAEADADAEAALKQLQPFLRPEKTQDARLILTRIVSKVHRGPIPSAEELDHLERVLPGSAIRCFEMAEREQTHRHSIDDKIVTREFSLRGRGQYLALIGLIGLLGVVCFLAYLGDTVSAAALGSATIVGVVAVFVTGRSFDAKEIASTQSQPQQQSDGGADKRRISNNSPRRNSSGKKRS